MAMSPNTKPNRNEAG